MKHSRRLFFVMITILVISLLTAAVVYATQPEPVSGYVPFASYFPGPPGGVSVYDACDEILQGSIVQPAESPGKAIHGTFTSGDSQWCDGEPAYEGTCEFTLLPVEEAGNPDSEEGFAVVNRCTGELRGLHGTLIIHFDFTYDAMYHFDPSK